MWNYCSTSAEFSTAIMPVFLMGRCDFIGSGGVAVWVGYQDGESAEGMGKFN